jgi:hypothetical protein
MRSFKKDDIRHYTFSIILLAATVMIAVMIGFGISEIIKPKDVVTYLAGTWKINIDDYKAFATPEYDDSSWDTIEMPGSILLYVMYKKFPLKGTVCSEKRFISAPIDAITNSALSLEGSATSIQRQQRRGGQKFVQYIR